MTPRIGKSNSLSVGDPLVYHDRRLAEVVLRHYLDEHSWYVNYMGRKDRVLREAIADGDLMAVLSRKGGTGIALYVVNSNITMITVEKRGSGGVDPAEMLKWAEILRWRFDDMPGSIRHASTIEAARVLRRKIEEYIACSEDSLVESELSTVCDVLGLLAEAGDRARRAAIERARQGLIRYHSKRRSTAGREVRGRTRRGQSVPRCGL